MWSHGMYGMGDLWVVDGKSKFKVKDLLAAVGALLLLDM